MKARWLSVCALALCLSVAGPARADVDVGLYFGGGAAIYGDGFSIYFGAPYGVVPLGPVITGPYYRHHHYRHYYRPYYRHDEAIPYYRQEYWSFPSHRVPRAGDGYRRYDHDRWGHPRDHGRGGAIIDRGDFRDHDRSRFGGHRQDSRDRHYWHRDGDRYRH